MKQQRGFTLIELVMVIVILGILAAVAIPRFINLQADAAQAATEGVAGALASGSSINFAARSARATNGVAVTACTQLDQVMQGGTLPAGYVLSGPAGITSGAVVTCTVTNNNVTPSVSATFTAFGISP